MYILKAMLNKYYVRIVPALYLMLTENFWVGKFEKDINDKGCSIKLSLKEFNLAGKLFGRIRKIHVFISFSQNTILFIFKIYSS